MNTFTEEPVKELNVSFIYTSDHKIVKTKREKFKLNSAGSMSKEELLYTIKNNLIYDDTKYTLLSIALFNLGLDSNEAVTNFINDASNTELIHYKSINDIILESNINMFSDLTTIYILLTEYVKSKNNTKRIHIKSKIKSRRKQYKANSTNNSNVK
jgi:uncharacterized protein (DUF2235 family)